jgi:hypothetical protein
MRTASSLLLLATTAAALASLGRAREQAELACTPYTNPVDGVDVELCQGPWLDKDGLPIIDQLDGARVCRGLGVVRIGLILKGRKGGGRDHPRLSRLPSPHTDLIPISNDSPTN